MSLKKKTIAIIFAVFVFSGAMHLIVQELVVMSSFRELERERAVNNMGMVLGSLSREFQTLSTTASDWAYWDDLYHFAAGRNPEFLKTTLDENALLNIKLNLMNIYDQDGKMLWGKSLGGSGEELDFGDLSAPKLSAGHPLRQLSQPIGEVAGFVPTENGPLMLHAKNILTNERTGPASGSFVLGRFLDIEAVTRMADQLRLQLSVSIIPDGEPVPDWAPELAHGFSHSPILLKETRNVLESSTILADIHGRPFLQVRVDAPREVVARGRAAVLLATVTLSCAGLLVAGLLLFMLHNTILTPLARLTRHTVSLGETDNLRSRLDFERKDEIGVLAKAFDQMIGRLAEARKKLVDQSFQAGVAEMAGGVLHNIGNAMVPLQVGSANLKDELQAASVEELKTAIPELADPATTGNRREELARFVVRAGAEMAEKIERSKKHVADFARQIQYVQQILADQSHYARAARILEPLDMACIVSRAEQSMAAPMRAAMAVEIDPGVRGVGPVLSSRAALQQVVVNLMINAAESIMERGVEDGRLLVRAVREAVEGIPMVHFFFEDNGMGIEEEHLDRVFERNFSTKKRSSGLGLHWSANTVNALKGSLYAKNKENGGGACLHLLLPLAGTDQ